MDPRLQRKILEIVSRNEGKTHFNTIRAEIISEWVAGKPTPPQDARIKHQIDLLIIDSKLLKETDRTDLERYTLTSGGHRQLSPWYKKAWFFILHDKHNLYAILALLISVAAFIVSWLSLNN